MSRDRSVGWQNFFIVLIGLCIAVALLLPLVWAEIRLFAAILVAVCFLIWFLDNRIMQARQRNRDKTSKGE